MDSENIFQLFFTVGVVVFLVTLIYYIHSYNQKALYMECIKAYQNAEMCKPILGVQNSSVK